MKKLFLLLFSCGLVLAAEAQRREAINYYNPDNGSLLLTSTDSFVYNGSALVQSIYTLPRDFTTTLVRRIAYQYQGNRPTVATTTVIFANGNIDTTFRTSWFYNATNQLDSVVNAMVVSGSFQSTSKEAYHYNNQGNVDTLFRFNRPFGGNSLEPVGKTAFQYNSNNKPVLRRFFDFANGNFTISYIDSLVYDAQGRLQSQFGSYFDPSNQNFVLEYENTSYYTGNRQVPDSVISIPTDPQWSSNKITFTYVAGTDSLFERTIFRSNSGGWDTLSKEEHFYSGLASSNQLQSLLPMKAYPNPSSENLYLQMTAQADWQVRVADLSGKVVLETSFFGHQTNINLQQLPAGVYMIHAQSAAGMAYQKVVKQ